MYNKLRFKNGMLKALTLSYDDGPYDDVKLIEIMSKNGIKGTFNLNSSMFDVTTEEQKKALEERKKVYLETGNEVACHGVWHYHLTDLTYPEMFHEIFDDRLRLEKEFGVMVRGMAYAFSDHNAAVHEILKQSGICYSRVVGSTGWYDMPTSWLEIRPTAHHDDANLFEVTERFIKAEENYKSEPMLFYLWGHAYEFRVHNNWDRMEKFAEMIGKREDIWYATNIEIYDYVQAYNSLIFSADGRTVYNPTQIDVWFAADYKKTVSVPAGQTVKF